MQSSAEPQIYIFQSMAPQAGYNYLMEKAKSLPNIQEIKNEQQALWLLRESSTQPGFLTIDYILWSKKEKTWLQNSMRMALHKDIGWINANEPNTPEIKEAIASIQSVNAETAANHEASLNSYIASIEKPKFNLNNRINPLKHQQAKSSLYTRYAIADLSSSQDARPVKREVSLTPGVLQSISCEITGKVFKDPVVLKEDRAIVVNKNKTFLRKGKSYERSELQRLGIPDDKFYGNFTLKKVIDRLGCNDKGKIETLDEDRLNDAVLLDMMEKPLILPSGHSFSQETIQGLIASQRTLLCPNTRQPFTRDDPVPNINLDRFLKAWPQCKQLLVSSLEGKLPPPSSSAKL